MSNAEYWKPEREQEVDSYHTFCTGESKPGRVKVLYLRTQEKHEGSPGHKDVELKAMSNAGY
jgi:hypothetical protein